MDKAARSAQTGNDEQESSCQALQCLNLQSPRRLPPFRLSAEEGDIGTLVLTVLAFLGQCLTRTYGSVRTTTPKATIPLDELGKFGTRPKCLPSTDLPSALGGSRWPRVLNG